MNGMSWYLSVMNLDLGDRNAGNNWEEPSSCCMQFTCAAKVLCRSDSYLSQLCLLPWLQNRKLGVGDG